MKKISKIKKEIIGIVLLLIIVLLSYIFGVEQKNISVDEYNFTQFEKAKVILDNIPKDAKKFNGLKKFNEKYNANIKPIKNCYTVSNDNGKEPYIFGFKIESFFYKIKLGKSYIVHPGYDLPIYPECPGDGSLFSNGCIDNINYVDFIRIISNPCRD